MTAMAERWRDGRASEGEKDKGEGKEDENENDRRRNEARPAAGLILDVARKGIEYITPINVFIKSGYG